MLSFLIGVVNLNDNSTHLGTYFCNDNPQIERGHQAGTSRLLKDYCDGRLFRNHDLFSSHSNALQILLYYDDVEVVNPIGSHRKVHKLGMLK